MSGVGDGSAANDCCAGRPDRCRRGTQPGQEVAEEPLRARKRAELACCLPFGPYAGFTVDEVAVIDPAYLLSLVREGVGPPEMRAAAARALARRQALASGGPRAPGRERSRLPRTVGASRAGAPPSASPRGAGETPDAAWGPSGRRRAFGRVGALLVQRPWLAALAVGALAVGVLAVGQAISGRQGTVPSGWSLVGPDAGGQLDRSRQSATPAARPTSADAVPSLGDSGSAPATGARGGSPAAGQSGASRAAAGRAAVRPCGQRSAGAIPAAEAARYIDSFQAVEFEVVQTKDTGRVTYLNSHDPYAGHFYVAVFPGDYAKFSQPPAILFRGKCIVVQGVIEAYRGTPQIVLRTPDDVRILDD